jgi:hypothetical protein
LSQVRRLDQIPSAQDVAPSDRIAIWQQDRTRVAAVGDLVNYAATAATAAAIAATGENTQAAIAASAATKVNRDGTSGFTGLVDVVTPSASDSAANNQRGVNGFYVRQLLQGAFLTPEDCADYSKKDIGLDPNLDASDAINSANERLGGASGVGGGVINLSRGRRYLVGQNIALYRNVGFDGATGRADPGNPFGISAPFFAAMRKTSALIMDPAARIRFAGNGGLQSVNVFRRGMALDGSDKPDNFTGSPFWAQETDTVYANDSTVIGFDRAFDFTNVSKIHMDSVAIDCLNGVRAAGAADISEFNRLHCYGITQAGATGHETFSNRSGKALEFTGVASGGPRISKFFAYAFNVGIDMNVPGPFNITDSWIDGTYDAATGYTLDTGRIGLWYRGTANGEIHVNNLRICEQATAMMLAAGNFSTANFNLISLYNNIVAINCSATNVRIRGLTNRTYRDNAIILNSKAAADSFVAEGDMFGRGTSAVDVNCGTGDPDISRLRYIGGTVGKANYGPYFIVPDNSGVIQVSDLKDRIIIFPSVATTDIQPCVPGKEYTFVAGNTGAVFSGAKFKLDSGAASVTMGAVGSTIRFRANDAGNGWIEQARKFV